ncbi:hypothetical protein LINGRAPRIM_LOCUS193 [Linum grandiflorum]
MGDLGLRSASEMNLVFLMAVAWGFLMRPNELWANVLLTKYTSQTEGGMPQPRSTGFSAAWRMITKGWPTMMEGAHWDIRSGRQTKFWTYMWLDSGSILLNHVSGLQGLFLATYVADFVLDDGSWNSTLISSCLPVEISL